MLVNCGHGLFLAYYPSLLNRFNRVPSMCLYFKFQNEKKGPSAQSTWEKESDKCCQLATNRRVLLIHLKVNMLSVNRQHHLEKKKWEWQIHFENLRVNHEEATVNHPSGCFVFKVLNVLFSSRTDLTTEIHSVSVALQDSNVINSTWNRSRGWKNRRKTTRIKPSLRRSSIFGLR